MRATVPCAPWHHRPILIIICGGPHWRRLSLERERAVSSMCSLSARRPSPPPGCVKVVLVLQFGTDARLDCLIACPIPAAAVLKVQLKESLLLNVQSA